MSVAPIVLRGYQAEALEDARAEYRAGKRAVLLVSPTGSGKTAMGAFVARSHVDRTPGGLVLVVVPRVELAAQWAETLARVGLRVGLDVDAADQLHLDGAAPHVVVATVQALLARKAFPVCSLVIADEAHHYVSAEWHKVIAPHVAKGARILGLTATPERGDGTALGELFDALVVVASIAELTAAGYLVPCAVVAPEVPKVKAEPGAAVLAADPVDAYLEHGRAADGTLRRAIIFAAGIKHGRGVVDALRARGVAADGIDSRLKPDERAARIARFRSGETRALVNVAILTEGFDDPSVEVIVLARKIGHVGLYLQIVGRGLRPSPDTGKDAALLLDLGGSRAKHGDPAEERDYSLTGEAITRKKKKPRKCAACGVVLRARDLREERCRTCGFRLSGGPVVTIDAVPLRLVAPDAAGRDRRSRIVAELAAEVVRRGWKPGALYHRARDRGIELTRREAARALREAAESERAA